MKKRGDMADYRRQLRFNLHTKRGRISYWCTGTEYRRYMRRYSHRGLI